MNTRVADDRRSGTITPSRPKQTAWSRGTGELDQRSHERNRALLGIDGASCTGIDFASYGLGTERTLAEYERYVGLSFAHRGVQPALIDGAPPEPAARVRQSDDEWKSTLKRANEVRVWVHQNQFSEVLAPLLVAT